MFNVKQKAININRHLAHTQEKWLLNIIWPGIAVLNIVLNYSRRVDFFPVNIYGLHGVPRRQWTTSPVPLFRYTYNAHY